MNSEEAMERWKGENGGRKRREAGREGRVGVEKNRREIGQQGVKGREGRERVQRKSKGIIVGRKRENGERCT